MQKLLWAVFIVLISVLAFACKTEDQRNSDLLPAKMAAIGQYRLLSNIHLLHHFILPYDSKFIPAHIKPKFIDSVLTDGDGYELLIDLGTGTTCRDGFKRRGKCKIEISDSMRTYKSVGSIRFTRADSFGILTAKGWNFFDGFVIVKGINADSAMLSYGFKLLVDGQKSFTYASANTALVYSREGSFNQYQTGITMAGSFVLSIGSNNYGGFASNLIQHPGCYSLWNQGTFELTNEVNTLWKVDFDPFSNDACDYNFKVSRKIKHQLFETVYEAW